ncbi:hypothetical protein DW322_15570 [Rhodococcus rhodnii]|uniref:Biotin synthase auxiliary protein n=1 Tax=Rhodococcus rhodnii TaxID=38312 RepID=A0A6P2CHZ6_9NOCA|nr:hypothetical protein [Rhodococcus rhodnii]TXG91371.1 hypothetical protein DW322_15570 [Rhodococcus rhodnii]
MRPSDAGPGDAPRFDPFTGVALDGSELGGSELGAPELDGHPLEPPRYCPSCGRRMIVQIDPVGWWARCSRHGTTTSGTATHGTTTPESA